MDSRYRDVVTNSHITWGISSYLKLTFILCIEDKENFLFRQLFLMIPWAQRLQYDKVVFRSLNLNDIHNPVIDIYRKWEFLFAEFTIDLFVLDDHMSFYYLHCLISLEPLLEAFEMDSSHGSRAATGWDHRVEVLVIVVLDCVVVVQADTANHGGLSCIWWLSRCNLEVFLD